MAEVPDPAADDGQGWGGAGGRGGEGAGEQAGGVGRVEERIPDEVELNSADVDGSVGVFLAVGVDGFVGVLDRSICDG